ncbi:MAG: 4Fe-4S binding protein [Anaerolineae bacterium]|nr:4Fe-4S binding protein [Anaerolineae bacterium]
MVKQIPLRQRIRKALVIIAFLSFPLTMNYLSPYVIIDGASQGIINGSLVMFGLMFLSSLFLGRLWCGWVCPAGGLQEMLEPLNRTVLNGKRVDWVKWLVWIPWIFMIFWLALQAGGYHSINLFLDTQNGISVAGAADRPIEIAYIIYYGVVALIFGVTVWLGKRGFCHTLCWMAPFMMIGLWLRNRLGWPSLRLQADSKVCTDCKTCTRGCPMSLDVNAMVQAQNMRHLECILCGTCVDNCAARAIGYTFSSEKK